MTTHWVGMILYVLDKSANMKAIRDFGGDFFVRKNGQIAVS